ncbi:MAG: SurA N-terminal domain-containing protein [Nitrospirae bacterium]|nr:SurA N-terminal domain-containing protein [Nitrospirota bacterium]
MLKTMRHHAKYFYVLFFIVILSFIFWGVGTVDKTVPGDVVAEVDQYKISAEEYWRTYDRAFGFYKEIYKEKFDEEMQKKLNLKESILNTLIEGKVLLVAAKKYGITVGDDELNEAIRNESVFHKNGSFDGEVYLNRLRLNRLSPEAYESAKRQELIVSKVRRMIELSVAVPPGILSNIQGDDKTVKSITDSIVGSEKEKLVKSYVEGLKKGMKIKVYRDLLS